MQTKFSDPFERLCAFDMVDVLSQQQNIEFDSEDKSTMDEKASEKVEEPAETSEKPEQKDVNMEDEAEEGEITDDDEEEAPPAPATRASHSRSHGTGQHRSSSRSSPPPKSTSRSKPGWYLDFARRNQLHFQLPLIPLRLVIQSLLQRSFTRILMAKQRYSFWRKERKAFAKNQSTF
jgi:hypothetical protein